MSLPPDIVRSFIRIVSINQHPRAEAGVAGTGAAGYFDDPSVAARSVGRRDAALSGWFRNRTGELFPGFRVGARDTIFDGGAWDNDVVDFCIRRRAAVIPADRGHGAAAPTHLVRPATATRVYCLDVLQNVDDPARTLRELARVGKPGALYLLSVPDPLQQKLQGLSASQHVFERDEFARMVIDADLEIEQSARYGFFWAMHQTLAWSCQAESSETTRAVLRNWALTWSAVLDAPQGLRLKRLLDDFLPRSQVIRARKPYARGSIRRVFQTRAWRLTGSQMTASVTGGS